MFSGNSQGCARFAEILTVFQWTHKNLEFRRHRMWSLNRQLQCKSVKIYRAQSSQYLALSKISAKRAHPWIQGEIILVIKRAQTCHLLCKRPGCYHSTSKIHVRDTIFNWGQFILQRFIRFPEFAEFTEFLFYWGKTPLQSLLGFFMPSSELQ